MGVAPNGRHLYVTNYYKSTLSVIDTTDLDHTFVAATIGVDTHPTGVAVAPDGRHVYVTNSGSDSVSVIDTSRDTVTGTIAINGGSNGGVAVAPDSLHVYVTNPSNTVSVIDAIGNKVTGTITVGTRPVGVAVTPDCRHLYVTNSGSDNVSMIDI